MSVTANDGDDEDDDSETRFLTRGANGKARIIWHSDTSPEKRLTKARTWLISLYGCSIVMYYLCIYTGCLGIGTIETEITIGKIKSEFKFSHEASYFREK